jgi:dTDP-4-amino-4,6-dideoxygalactose transaminase
MSAAVLTALPPMSPAVWARRPARSLPFPLGEPSSRLFARARHALCHGVLALGLGPGDEVLVPAYHHGSEVEALRRAGLTCRFYDIGPRLEPRAADLEAIIGERTRALQIIHYLGVPQDTARWRRWCHARGLLLLEDAAHAWLAWDDGRPVGAVGDLAIFCLYKSVGLPDGAVLVSRRPTVAPGPRPRKAREMLLEHGLWLASRSDALGAAATTVRRHRPRRYDPRADFALGTPAPPSASTRAALPRLAARDIAERRRANFDRLAAELGDLVPAALAAPPNGACPLVIPVGVVDKPGLLRALRRGGIRPLDLWSVPHPSLDAARFPRAAALRRTLVGLPVHQELRARDVDRIAAAVCEARPVPANGAG